MDYKGASKKNEQFIGVGFPWYFLFRPYCCNISKNIEIGANVPYFLKAI